MAKISKEQVKELANLARIGLTENEKESFVKEMTSILHYVEELNQIDTSKVKSTSQVTDLANVLRDDKKIVSEFGKEALLSNAPTKENGFIKVNKVLE
jgi:aspartyl-tRNA(Asn)/glutamyl-tRNA(Gln) amidotransferase subunit C